MKNLPHDRALLKALAMTMKSRAALEEIKVLTVLQQSEFCQRKQ